MQPSRTLFAGIMMALGVISTVFLVAWMNQPQTLRKPGGDAVAMVWDAPPPPQKPPAARRSASQRQRTSNARTAHAATPHVGVELSGIAIDAGLDVDLRDAAADLLKADGKAGMVRDAASVDSPPRAIGRITPRVSDRVLARGLEGRVEVEFVVDESGRVGDVEIVASEPPGVFDQAVVEAIRGAHFSAAQDGGESVKVRVKQSFVFQAG